MRFLRLLAIAPAFALLAPAIEVVVDGWPANQVATPSPMVVVGRGVVPEAVRLTRGDEVWESPLRYDHTQGTADWYAPTKPAPTWPANTPTKPAVKVGGEWIKRIAIAKSGGPR